MKCEVLYEKFDVTKDELECMAKPFEAGVWPSGTTKLVRRPHFAEDELISITARLPVSMVKRVDKIAKHYGKNRSWILRHATEQFVFTNRWF